MPNYWNPNNFYPATYANNMYSGNLYPTVQPQMPQQSYAQEPVVETMRWVEGEVGAKAFQMPSGWPANKPIPLWDSTDTVIYLKSVNQMGVPNPMQKLRYTIEEQPQQALLNGTSGSNGQNQSGVDMSQYVTKHDFDQLRQEIHEMNRGGNSGNQNGSYSGANNTAMANGGSRGGGKNG